MVKFAKNDNFNEQKRLSYVRTPMVAKNGGGINGEVETIFGKSINGGGINGEVGTIFGNIINKGYT